jgi:N-acetyl-alpha-D-muramate 1-phosphate uridylyltransferase
VSAFSRGNIWACCLHLLTLRTPRSALHIQPMVLAAGRGERMRPLTDSTPKPLLRVRGQPLMQWPMQALARGGFVRQLVNTAWLGEQIPAHFGNGFTGQACPRCTSVIRTKARTLAVRWRPPAASCGPCLAWPTVFWVVAGDVFAPDFVFSDPALQSVLPPALPWRTCGWCPTPCTTRAATLACRPQAKCSTCPKAQRACHTFSTIALYKKAFFADCGLPTG